MGTEHFWQKCTQYQRSFSGNWLLYYQSQLAEKVREDYGKFAFLEVSFIKFYVFF